MSALHDLHVKMDATYQDVLLALCTWRSCIGGHTLHSSNFVQEMEHNFINRMAFSDSPLPGSGTGLTEDISLNQSTITIPNWHGWSSLSMTP